MHLFRINMEPAGLATIQPLKVANVMNKTAKGAQKKMGAVCI